MAAQRKLEREVVDLDELMPEGWVARISGEEFPIPGDLPMELWLSINRQFIRAQKLTEESTDSESLAVLTDLYDRIVDVIRLETPEAVPTQYAPVDADDDWEAEYPDGAVVVPDMSPMTMGNFMLTLRQQMGAAREDESGDPPKARRRASTTSSSRNGSGGGRRRSTAGSSKR